MYDGSGNGAQGTYIRNGLDRFGYGGLGGGHAGGKGCGYNGRACGRIGRGYSELGYYDIGGHGRRSGLVGNGGYRDRERSLPNLSWNHRRAVHGNGHGYRAGHKHY